MNTYMIMVGLYAKLLLLSCCSFKKAKHYINHSESIDGNGYYFACVNIQFSVFRHISKPIHASTYTHRCHRPSFILPTSTSLHKNLSPLPIFVPYYTHTHTHTHTLTHTYAHTNWLMTLNSNWMCIL